MSGLGRIPILLHRNSLFSGGYVVFVAARSALELMS